MTSEQRLHNDEYRLFQVGLCPVNTSYECKYETRFDVTNSLIRSNNLHQLSCDQLVQNIDLLRKSHVTSTFVSHLHSQEVVNRAQGYFRNGRVTDASLFTPATVDILSVPLFAILAQLLFATAPMGDFWKTYLVSLLPASVPKSPIGFARIFMWTFPEPWTLLSSVVSIPSYLCTCVDHQCPGCIPIHICIGSYRWNLCTCGHT